MADGHHFENGYISIISAVITRFRLSSVCRCVMGSREESSDKKSKLSIWLPFLAIFQRENRFCSISASYVLINVTLGDRKHDHAQKHVTWPKQHIKNTKKNWASPQFLPRDAMRKRGLLFTVARCLSVCLSSCHVSTRLKISSNFFLGPIVPSF